MSSSNSAATTVTGGRCVPTAEDQQQINRFARLHKAYLAAKDELASLNNQLQNLSDAADELLLLDDEAAASVPLQVGSVFVHYDQDTLADKLEARKEEKQQQMTETRAQIAGMEAEMKELRALLYAKFGDNIQLEDENGGEGGGGAASEVIAI